jgi:hypothetical protein
MTVLSPVQQSCSEKERKQVLLNETLPLEQNKKFNIDDITSNLEVRKRERTILILYQYVYLNTLNNP